MKWLAWLFAFVAGTLITCQVGSNSQLKKSLGQPLPALFVNYAVGIAAVLLYTSVKQVHFFLREKLSRRHGGDGLADSLGRFTAWRQSFLPVN